MRVVVFVLLSVRVRSSPYPSPPHAFPIQFPGLRITLVVFLSLSMSIFSVLRQSW
ncbi:hypothetical protein K466DRAFT_592573 [Polyporus arcularius HHB13444]|uniref:Uncharacterized protein n=1 Tax=Polyporus arcularius HHB13444 TaxID=1314778 RepID=A0A5C3NP59_9APHY|nr:hypothetical protein K466DRAFT_592573 [Polyporus arcularius HHB13444]